ncbi:MAG: hypothetical protein HN849_02030 [Victivallales bacterium]|jgi:hypothetical protein|nr:hypothetical protein [Victivallales bacterium]
MAVERTHLRDLAGRYAEYASGTVMQSRREKWRLHNRLEARTFPFHIEDNGSYLSSRMPALQCTSPACRGLEARLLRALVSYEAINDDRIIPDRFVVDWVTAQRSYCDELRFTHSEDEHGGTLGFESNKPIQDIDADFHKLKKRALTLNREATQAHAELASAVFAGLLPVAVGRPSSTYSEGIANKAVHLMGMQELFMQMVMNPEAVHRLFTFFAEENLARGAWEEEQGLLTLNNDGNQGYCSGSSQYTDELPSRAIPEGERILNTDRYGYLEAQEATGLSPDMFAEFLMPHFQRLAAKFRFIKFGCCEPVHALMPHLQKLPSLRKVSVTPWCDQEALAAGCRKDIIWSRKPVPLKLCGTSFNPDEFRAHLQETLDIGKEFFIEFVFRDTTSLTGAMESRVTQTCEIVRELTGHPEGSK